MTTTVHTETWHEANQRYLVAALGRLMARLQQYAAHVREESVEDSEGDAQQAESDMQELAVSMASPPAIERITQAFALSSFERDLLLLCAGIELDTKLAESCRLLTGSTRHPHVTFSMAMAVLEEPHWSALIPAAPLRHWRMLELGGGESLTRSPLRIDETILHYLAGTPHLDDRLHSLVQPQRASEGLLPSHQELMHGLLALWSRTEPWQEWPPIQLVGSSEQSRREVAASLCEYLGLGLYRLRAKDLPASMSERESLVRLWERQWLLTPSALLLCCEAGESPETTNSARHFIEGLKSPSILTGREPLVVEQRRVVLVDLPEPTAAEQREQWDQVLGPLAVHMNGQVDQAIAQFRLTPQAIKTVGEAVAGYEASGQVQRPSIVLWDACRKQVRAKLDGLAHRITSAVTWEDLIVPDQQRNTLREIAATVRQRTKVYETWGFAGKESRGLGMAVLFSGSSGTGKTLAAEVLANELRLDLYRIELSQVVSKYIGETEKNLHRVFEAAEESGAVLLFDEADAFFGRRSEVKDSHDRYANIEVSYLLQRMEAYRGLAVLTTNMRDALDPAFLRRLRFVVDFPFPNLQQRAEIWARVFPSRTPTEGLDLAKLARLNVAGGNIRNIALNAAFLAADGEESVQMKHLLNAARSEYTKLGKPLNQSETAGWV
jgi:ATP-dependent 26S proteasome regulatory subunit